MRFNHKQHWKKKAEIPQKLDFLTWSFNISTENSKFCRKNESLSQDIILLDIDLANELYDTEEFLISILCLLLLKIVVLLRNFVNKPVG